MKKLLKQWGVLLLACLLGFDSEAQMFDYGCSSVTKLSDPNMSSGVLYTDQKRARVTSRNTMTSVITLSDAKGTFAPGDEVLIIQMVGGVVGTHELTILGGTSPNFTLPLAHSYSYSGSDRVQIIEVSTYVDFTLNGGLVTCNRWDGNTGGILAMRVCGTLTVNGGTFSAAGKGYTSADLPGWAADVSGAGGATTIGNGGGIGNAGDAAMPSGGYDFCTFCVQGTNLPDVVWGQNGGNGGAANSGNPAVGNSVTIPNYGGSTLNTNIVMGRAGGYATGYGAGAGSSGGGAGGGGGASDNGGGSANPGLAGAIGEDGKPGGRAGKGGAGGGIIYIKAGTFDINVSLRPVFVADGERGGFGGYGGNGGAGGAGGAGGIGYCAGGLYYLPGFSGGSGAPGIGGDGGDGGNGGWGGTIWLVSRTSPNAIVANNASVEGGEPGYGGEGGFGVRTGCTAPTALYPPPGACSTMDLGWCNSYGGTGGPGGVGYTIGGPPICPDVHVCDCEKAYNLLKSAESIDVIADPDKPAYSNSSSIVVAYYDKIINRLVGVEEFPCPGGTYKKYYHCPVRGSGTDCNDMFDNMPRYMAAIPTGTITDLIGTWPTGSLQHLEFYNNTSQEVEMNYLTENQFLYDFSSIHLRRCYNTACDPYDVYNTSYLRGNPGRDGENQHNFDGSIGTSINDNVPLDGTGSPGVEMWKNGPRVTGNEAVYVDSLNAKVYPVPFQKELTVSLKSEASETIILTLYDMKGAEMHKQEVIIVAGINNLTLNTESLLPGAYVLQINSGGKIYSVKILKNTN